MKKAVFAAIATAMIAASPALASDDDSECSYQGSGERMEQQQIRARLEEQGYDVRSIKTEDGCYEAYAIDNDGRRVELDIDPVSGETRKMEYDD
jgi:hypothetical protein